MSDKIVFLADDDGDDRFFIQQAIQSSGLKVTLVEAEDGLELIKKINGSQSPISLIIIDMNMPKMNGLEAMHLIKTIPQTENVPVVMISTSPNQALIEKAYSAGVDSFMPKPNTFEEFSDLIAVLQKRFLS